MKNLPWFRLYQRIIDDEKIRLIAFEDRWHFIALCCLKADGLLDEPENSLKERKIAVKMGVQTRELDEIKRRLFEVGLTDENMHPLAWDELQFRSDTSTERVRKYREKTKVKRTKRYRNVSVTAQDTDTDTDTEVEPNGSISPEADKSAPSAIAFLPCVSGEEFPIYEADVSEWSSAFPAVDVRQQIAAMRSWLNANTTRRKTKRGMRKFIVSWLDRRQNSGTALPRAASPPGRRMNAVEANLSLRAETHEPSSQRYDHGDVELLPPNKPGLQALIADAGKALTWGD